MEARLKLLYMDRRGAGCVDMVTPAEAVKKLKRLRCEAVLETEAGEVVGGIEVASGGQDDQRIRWCWWYDKQITGER